MTHCRNVLVLAIALGASAGLVVLPGCSTTKNVMHKATFGLVGNEERSEADSRKEAKAERKAREREEKQQRKAEKRARRDEAKARKTAQKEEKSQQANAKPKRGLLDRMTFGMVGGDDESDGPKKQEKRAKAEAEEQERAEKKRAEKAAKEDEEAQKRAAKQDAEQTKREEKEASEKRGLMNRMTFGLAGGHKKTDEEKAQEKAAKAEAKEAARAEKQHKKDQERREDEVKAAEKREAKERKEAEQAAAQAESNAEAPSEKRSMMSRMTFGLVGGGKKQHSDSETAPDSPAEAATVEAPQREVSESATPAGTTTEPAIAEDKPKEKRGWMSRMTFGLVGGGEKKEMHDEMPVGGEAGGTSTAAQPALPPEHLAMAAPANVAYDVQPASAMGAEERKLAKLPFKTMIDLSTKSASGRPQATASRETYSRSGYGITDIGDVRIAVRDMTFNGESRAGGIVIASDDRAPAGGRSGIGNESFVFEYARGVTACTFGSVQFTISKSVINIGGKSIPLGQGRKLVVVDQQGNVLGAYAAE